VPIRIHSTDMVLPTATQPQRNLRLRCVVCPDRPRRHCSIALGYTCLNGCDTLRLTSNVVPILQPKLLKNLTCLSDTAEVGLSDQSRAGIVTVTTSERDVIAPYESVRRWWKRFGQSLASRALLACSCATLPWASHCTAAGKALKRKKPRRM
jgi:hypothetical protein